MILCTVHTFRVLLVSGNPTKIVQWAAGPDGMTSAMHVGHIAVPTVAVGICLGIKIPKYAVMGGAKDVVCGDGVCAFLVGISLHVISLKMQKQDTTEIVIDDIE